MSVLRHFVLAHDQARAGVAEFAKAAPAGTVVEFKEPTRTLEQNARMWAMLGDIAKQVQWPVDGELRWLDTDEWKQILSAAMKRELRIARGVDGGQVILAPRTSRMTKRELSDLMEVIAAFGAAREVVWSEPAHA
jgi:hypothetical protein